MSRKQWDVHHLFCRSTFPHLASHPWNQRPTRMNHHRARHLLGGNQSPLAVLVALFHEFTPYDKRHLLHDPALDEFRKLLEGLPKKEEA